MDVDKLYERERLLQRSAAVLQNVTHPRYSFAAEYKDDEVVLRVVCSGTDNVDGSPLPWKGRKWLLSRHMTDGEIVQTAFLAAKTADEHELREQFKFFGVSVFDPHYDIYKLAAFRSSFGSIKERDAA